MDCLEYNLRRLNETENLFEYEKTLTKSRPKYLRRKELTLYEEGKNLYKGLFCLNLVAWRLPVKSIQSCVKYMTGETSA
jgi:hypothetical protein